MAVAAAVENLHTGMLLKTALKTTGKHRGNRQRKVGAGAAIVLRQEVGQ